MGGSTMRAGRGDGREPSDETTSGMTTAARIAEWLRTLSCRFNLLGLCSADFIRNGDSYTLLEINPRPGATLDIFDDAEAPLIKAHLDASAGRPFVLPRFRDAMAAMIAYTPMPIARFPALAWPDWVAVRALTARAEAMPNDSL